MVSEYLDLNLHTLPEMKRINAEFEDFSSFIKEVIIIHEASIELVDDKDGKSFESAVMWIEVEKRQTFHLIRSSGYRIRQIIKAVISRNLFPCRCIPMLAGNSHMLVPPDVSEDIPF